MKVLVVEDEVKLARLIKQGLQRHNFTVDLAHDGVSGLDMAAGGGYDVIILDWMLPKLDGLQVCQRLRREEKIDTPILMLTAKQYIDDKVNALDDGADDYLTKPFVFKELLARLRALARRGTKPINHCLTTDGLKVCLKDLQVNRYHKPIKLTKKELSLLIFLLKNKGQVVSKDQIINHVWSYETNVLDNTVEAYIKLLRQKIEAPFPTKPKLIETVRGFGYRIKDV